MLLRRVFPLVLGLSAWGHLAGCGGDEIKPDSKPIVGVLELPITLRTGGQEPANAAHVEIGTSEIRVDGEPALTLENGKVPAAEQSGGKLPKLAGKLAGKSALAISVHAATPYSTLARVMSTGLSSGAKQLAFKVRKPNSTSETGWLVVRDSHFVESSEDGRFGLDALLPWETFANVWEESLDACKATDRGDCGYSPLAKAAGGKLDMMLRVRGSGLALRFRQAGAPAPAEPKPEETKKPKVEMLEGIKAAPQAEEAPPEPSTEHVFTLRGDQATAVPSPISGITKPVCSSQTCPTVVDAEGISMSGKVLALVGAAFPDGTPEPKVAWVTPP